jgi:RNA polymerase sigma-54 factor
MSKLRQTLSFKQTQNLLLKPKMLQSLEMLALPLLELEMHIKQELEKNPMLEIQDQKEESEETAEKAKNSEEQKEKPAEETDPEIQKTIDESKELSEILDSWQDTYEYKSERNFDQEKMNFDHVVAAAENKLGEFLLQLDSLKLTEDENYFAQSLVDGVNTYGFLPEEFDINTLAEEYEVSAEKAEEIHQLILGLEPCGITALNINQCLVAQLSPKQKNEVICDIIEKSFDDMIHKKYKKLCSEYDISMKAVLKIKEQISVLDPKPGLRLQSNQTDYIIPDVIIKKIGPEYEIIINDYYVPKIRLSRKYNNILKNLKHDKNAVDYVRNKINSAKFLIKSIYLRNRTLERVTKAIIRNQVGFFYENTGVLNPLTYSVIAEELQVNESTISRVVRIKYADTPFGIFCLKDFFTSKAGKDMNYNSVSRHSVESKIKKMIDNENKKKPLSDQDIADALRETGINVSRRVIAKYRKAKGILNSHLRREE